jgi:hypothetical protein
MENAAYNIDTSMDHFGYFPFLPNARPARQHQHQIVYVILEVYIQSF